MARQIPSASIARSDFACPHCGAHASQNWYSCFASRLEGSTELPAFFNLQGLLAADAATKGKESYWRCLALAKQTSLGLVVLEPMAEGKVVTTEAHSLHLSQCFTCEKTAIWVHKTLIYPARKLGAEPCPDLPADVLRDYDEARAILELSPRGAAALLRLAVQKLCKDLGESGKNINEDIANLVKKGLDVHVQYALDTVRVIGNEAVHPGQMDLNDDRDTAIQLFDLVNFIADEAITKKRRVAEMYAKVPLDKRDAIAKRDARA